jgi:hypothetical protein
MKIKNILLIGSLFVFTGLLVLQQIEIHRLEQRYNEERVLFDANYGEVIRLKDDLGAYADSCRLYRKELEALKQLD